MYTYCLNNPVILADDTGTAAEEIFAEESNDLRLPFQLASGAAGLIFLAGSFALFHKMNSKKPVNLPSHKKVKLDIDHITSGHMPNGDRNPDGNKSVFWGLTTQQVIKAIYEAYNASTKIQTQGVRVKLVGYSSTFRMTIEIWLNLVTEMIETAYPK